MFTQMSGWYQVVYTQLKELLFTCGLTYTDCNLLIKVVIHRAVEIGGPGGHGPSRLSVGIQYLQ